MHLQGIRSSSREGVNGHAIFHETRSSASESRHANDFAVFVHLDTDELVQEGFARSRWTDDPHGLSLESEIEGSGLLDVESGLRHGEDNERGCGNPVNHRESNSILVKKSVSTICTPNKKIFSFVLEFCSFFLLFWVLLRKGS